MATVEMMVCFEELVFSAPSCVLQCWAGVQVALGHGVLRWSDLRHSKDFTLTDDALMGITWRMKKRSVQVPWAALRIGISGGTGLLSGLKFFCTTAHLVRTLSFSLLRMT